MHGFLCKFSSLPPSLSSVDENTHTEKEIVGSYGVGGEAEREYGTQGVREKTSPEALSQRGKYLLAHIVFLLRKD